METEASNAMSDNFSRIATFQQYPLPVPGGQNHASLLRYNSPLKLSNAGFYRYPEAQSDEVRCYRCSVCYRGWTGESPMAVHRILNPDCPHVIGQTPARLTAPMPIARVGANRVRRRLQMGSPTPNQASNDATDDGVNHQSVLDVYSNYNTPGTPDLSDTEDDGAGLGSMLFESHRLLTFPSPTHPLSEEWAASGFVHQGEGGVVRCVFCGVELQYEADQPSEVAKVHQQQSQNCPLVKYLDVGNIPRDLENIVRSKHLEQINGDCSASSDIGEPLFKHPQFEEAKVRLDTFKYWPRQMNTAADTLCQAGFYFSGHADKVVCFACGCGLRNWDPEADPWTQHARHAPHCVFVKQERGDSFIMDAQEAEVLTDCDTPAEDSYSVSSLHTSPLRPSLDMSAITAALACQYDVEQIRHAILKFFLSSRGSYPNEALLLGTLRASDVNFTQLQRQREQLHTKNQSIIRQAEQIQQKDQALERQGEVIERKDEVIEENQTDLEREQTERQRREREVRELQVMLSRKDTLVDSQARVIQRHSQQLRTTYLQVQEQADQLENKDSELERKQREMDRQAEENRRQAEEMRRQAEGMRRQAEEMQRLRQLLLANNIVDNNENDIADHNNANVPLVTTDPASSYTRCKICLEEDAQCLFRPCRHVCCGTHCAPRFIGDKCPICRDRVRDWEIIYVA